MSSYYFVGQTTNGGPINGSTATFTGNVTSGGQFLAANGSAAAPSYAFTNSTSTGLYRAGTNILGFSTAGTSAGTINASQEWGIGGAPVSTYRFTTVGSTTNSSAAAFLAQNSTGAMFFLFRNDGLMDWRGTTFQFSGTNPIIQGTGQTLTIGNLSAFAGGRIVFPSANTGTVTFNGPTGSLTAQGFSFDKSVTMQRFVQLKTSAYPVVAADSFSVFQNTGAGAQVTYTLPTAAVGLTYTFCNTAAGATFTKILAVGSDTIAYNGTLGAAAGNLTSAAVWNSVTIQCIAATVWQVTAVDGAWTLT